MVKISASDLRVLADLRDIHAQSYLVLEYIAVICIGLILVWFIYHYYCRAQRNAPRRTALSLLQQIALRGDTDYRAQSALISDILKRVALASYPRTQVASLQGQSWLDFLNKNAKNLDFDRVRELLLVLPYQHSQRSKISDPADMQLLCLYAKRWIKQQPVVKRR